MKELNKSSQYVFDWVILKSPAIHLGCLTLAVLRDCQISYRSWLASARFICIYIVNLVNMILYISDLTGIS
jgi:hypothetical protein